MERVKGSLWAKMLVFLLMGVFTAGITLFGILGIKLTDIIGDPVAIYTTKEYYSSGVFGNRVLEELEYILEIKQTQDSLRKDGKFDVTQTIDINRYSEGVSCEDKDENTTYTIAQLLKFENNYERLELYANNTPSDLFNEEYSEEAYQKFLEKYYKERMVWEETIALPQSGKSLAEYAKDSEEDYVDDDLNYLYSALKDAIDYVETYSTIEDPDSFLQISYGTNSENSSEPCVYAQTWNDNQKQVTGLLANTNAGTQIASMLSENTEFSITIDETKAKYMAFWTDKTFYDTYQKYFANGMVVLGICLVGWVLCFILSILQSGNKYGVQGHVVSRFTENIPIEVKFLLDCTIGGLLLSVWIEMIEHDYTEYRVYWVICAVFMAVMVVIFDGMLVTFIGKCKAKAFSKNSICKWIWKKGKEICSKFWRIVDKNTKGSVRIICLFIVFLFLNWLSLFMEWFWIIYLPILYVATVYLLLKESHGRQLVKEGLLQMADGNLDYQFDTTQLSHDNLEMAEALNHLNEGMKKAVDAQMKSERLKTDLITNVSHDIKTPLTSIINYVDLLKRENIEDEKIAGYIKVLEQKSARLKQLTEDLVDASKISSGNVEIQLQEIDLCEFLQQVNGEFEEKFESKNLQMVCKFPDSPLPILADGRHLFRVFDNLYNNAFKYAMTGTRVYIEIAKEEDKTVFTMRNISENPLNCSADELMERFVRGDVSRTTQGSGLGLEIARNLVQLQNGRLELYLDGDLFKVKIFFA
jgi:signal transduction histidine kinase